MRPLRRLRRKKEKKQKIEYKMHANGDDTSTCCIPLYYSTYLISCSGACFILIRTLGLHLLFPSYMYQGNLRHLFILFFILSPITHSHPAPLSAQLIFSLSLTHSTYLTTRMTGCHIIHLNLPLPSKVIIFNFNKCENKI